MKKGLVISTAIFLIKAYQVALSPILGGQCRFYPSCSEYSVQVLQKYGFWQGLGKSLWRIARCHPFHPGGYDPA